MSKPPEGGGGVESYNVSVEGFLKKLEKGRATASRNALTELGHLKQIFDAVLVGGISVGPDEIKILRQKIAAIRANIPFCAEKDKAEIEKQVTDRERVLEAISNQVPGSGGSA